jgi:Ankyrin repeats (3 copies)
VAQTIIDAARRERVATLQEQLDYALLLVSWSWIARQCGVQLGLLDVLVDAGASPDPGPNNALVNRNTAAAEHLVRRGARLTLATAVCLGRWDAAAELFEAANNQQQRLAFVAALNGKAAALQWMIAKRVDVNAPSSDLYAHGTPLHHAVSSGSLDAVKVLVEAGASVATPDTAWKGTPLGWAEHYVDENRDRGDRQGMQYEEIAAYLRAQNLRIR